MDEGQLLIKQCPPDDVIFDLSQMIIGHEQGLLRLHLTYKRT